MDCDRNKKIIVIVITILSSLITISIVSFVAYGFHRDLNTIQKLNDDTIRVDNNSLVKFDNNNHSIILTGDEKYKAEKKHNDRKITDTTKLKNLNEEELNNIFPAEEYINLGDEIIQKTIRKKLYEDFVNETETERLNFRRNGLIAYLNYCFEKKNKLQTILSTQELSCAEKLDQNKFNQDFINFIKNYKIKDLLDDFVFRSKSFNKNEDELVKEISTLISSNCNEIPQKSIEPDVTKTFDNLIISLTKVMEHYHYYMEDKRFITGINFKKQHDFTLDGVGQKILKEDMVSIWKLGEYIIREINLNILKLDRLKNLTELELFNQRVDYLIAFSLNKEENEIYPNNFDWDLFSFHYTTVLSYKLIIDYWMYKKIHKIHIDEILDYNPEAGYSKDIKRNGSEAAALSVNYIIAQLFKNKDNLTEFNRIVKKISESPVYNDIILSYNKANDSSNKNGLYYDNGFIVHDNLVSYSYLLDYAFPSIFYEKICGFRTYENIRKIFTTFVDISFRKRNVTPAISSKYGYFNEINLFLDEIIKVLDAINFDYGDDSPTNHIKNYKDNKPQPPTGIVIIPSARIILTNQETWSFQHKINSELSYGETNIYNNYFMKSIVMGKIVFDVEIENSSFENHNLYPGVISFGSSVFEYQKTLPINKKLFFEKVNYTYMVLDADTAVVYTKVKNNELELEYDEMVLITKIGVYVGYFNVIKHRHLEKPLFVTICSGLVNSFVDARVLYSDVFKTSQYLFKDKAEMREFDEHVLYVNLAKFYSPKNPHAVVYHDSFLKEIDIEIVADKRYEIKLKSNYGLHAKIIS